MSIIDILRNIGIGMTEGNFSFLILAVGVAQLVVMIMNYRKGNKK